MKRTFWVIEQKLAGRPGPIVAPWNLKAIYDSGVTTIVSADTRCDSSEIRKIGFRHIEAFMPAIFPTTPALVNEFASLTEQHAAAVVEAVNKGETVLVHCYAGQDRTGLILSATLVELHGIDGKEAVKIVRRAQPAALSSPGIIEAFEEYLLRRKASKG